jgi:hypothetical protein
MSAANRRTSKSRASQKRPDARSGRRPLGKWVRGLSRVASQRSRFARAADWVQCDGPSWMQDGGGWNQNGGGGWIQDSSDDVGPFWYQGGETGSSSPFTSPQMSAVAALARTRRS